MYIYIIWKYAWGRGLAETLLGEGNLRSKKGLEVSPHSNIKNGMYFLQKTNLLRTLNRLFKAFSFRLTNVKKSWGKFIPKCYRHTGRGGAKRDISSKSMYTLFTSLLMYVDAIPFNSLKAI